MNSELAKGVRALIAILVAVPVAWYLPGTLTGAVLALTFGSAMSACGFKFWELPKLFPWNRKDGQ